MKTFWEMKPFCLVFSAPSCCWCWPTIDVLWKNLSRGVFIFDSRFWLIFIQCDTHTIMDVSQIVGNRLSVTRLGDFLIFFVSRFLLKFAQIYGGLWAIWKHQFSKLLFGQLLENFGQLLILTSCHIGSRYRADNLLKGLIFSIYLLWTRIKR